MIAHNGFRRVRMHLERTCKDMIYIDIFARPVASRRKIGHEVCYEASEVERTMKADREPRGLCSDPVGRARGFTLIEIMVVIVIITLLAAIAVPSIAARLRSERARAVTEGVAGMFRGARLNALGRGAATVVRFEGGALTVLEAISGPGCDVSAIPGCTTIPVSSCTDIVGRFAAANQTSQELGNLDATDAGELTVTMGYRLLGGALSTNGAVDVCFSPMGRAFVRGGASSSALDTVPFQPLTTSAQVQVVNPNLASAIRFAVIAPNGAARAVHQ